MRILLVNDDGINADGIYAIAKELEKEHELIIVAPDTQRSAQSHSITLFNEIKLKEVRLDGLNSQAFSISGTPADCVRVGLETLIKEPVDLVVSGINMGYNSGMDVLYSGTVSAAIEANLYEIPSLALSAEYKDGGSNFEVAARYGREILTKIKKDFLKSKLVLNVNVPHSDYGNIKGIKNCRIGDPITDRYIIAEENGDEKTIRVVGRKDTLIKEGTDRYYLGKGYVTITPINYDYTHFTFLDHINTWL